MEILIVFIVLFVGFFAGLHHIYKNQPEEETSSTDMGCAGGCAGCPAAGGCAARRED